MKKTYLIICGLLNGCTFYNPADVLVKADINTKEKYQYFTTDKTMTKAFEAYEFLKIEKYDSCAIDFYVRFCDTNYFADKWIKGAIHLWGDYGYDKGLDNLTKIKIFQFLGNLDSTTRLSNEDIRCLALKCDDYINGILPTQNWINYDDECIVRRRNLLKNEALIQWCAFNYEDYIPKYAKIGTYNDFLRLYNSYKVDINECENKRENFEIASTEYDKCIQSVEGKVEQIVKSGILQW